MALQRGFPLSGMNFDSPGAAGKKFPRQKAREYFLVLQRGFPLPGINFDSPGAARKKSPRQKARRFFGAPAGISPAGDKLRLPGSSQKKISPPKGEEIFWCSSGDSNPNRITCFQYLSLSDNTFDNFLLRFTYRLTLLCTCCLRLSSRSV